MKTLSTKNNRVQNTQILTIGIMVILIISFAIASISSNHQYSKHQIAEIQLAKETQSTEIKISEEIGDKKLNYGRSSSDHNSLSVEQTDNTIKDTSKTSDNYKEEQPDTKTIFKLQYQIQSNTGISGIMNTSDGATQKYSLNSVESHAIVIKYPKGKIFEISFDGEGFSYVYNHDEGLIDPEYNYSNIIYTPQSWNGDLYVRSESGFDFTVYLIPDKDDSISTEQNFSLMASSPADYSGAMSTTLNIIPRSTWGADTASWDPYDSSDINSSSRLVWDPEFYRPHNIVVHHTATSPTSTPSDAVRDIYLYHTYSRGWGDIGYNYLIDQNGNIYEGKIGGEGTKSYHAYEEPNTNSISIALIGDFTSTGATAQAKDSLAKMIAEKSILFDIPIEITDDSEEDWLDTGITLHGHKSTYFWCFEGHELDHLCTDGSKWVKNPTACPGDTFYPTLKTEVVTDAQTYRDSSTFDQLKSIVSKVENQYTQEVEAGSGELLFVYNTNLTQTDVDNLIPNYSGITNKTIHNNKLVVEIEDWNNSGSVAPDGWQGWYTSQFPSDIDWKNERAKTLQKIFIFGGEWDNVSRNFYYDAE